MKLTPAMLAALRQVKRRESLAPLMFGELHSHHSTRRALERRGLIRRVESQWRLTPEGRKALEEKT